MGGGGASNVRGGRRGEDRDLSQARPGQSAQWAQLWHSSAWYIPFLCQTVPACTYLYASTLSLCTCICLPTFQGISVHTHTHTDTEIRTYTWVCAVAPFGYCDLSAGGHIYSLYCLVDVLVLVLAFVVFVLQHIIPEQRAINVHSKPNFLCSLRESIS